MAGIFAKTIAIWLVILIVAIVNAGVREKILVPVIGSGLALPASGLLLSVLVFLVAFISIPFFGAAESEVYITIGATWFALTLCFEFLFSHFVVGKAWLEIVQVFNVTNGNLFVVALLATLTAPWVSAKARGLI